MPSKTRKKKPVAALPTIPKELIDQIADGPMTAKAMSAAPNDRLAPHRRTSSGGALPRFNGKLHTDAL